MAVVGPGGRQSRQKSYLLIEYDGKKSQTSPKISDQSQIRASGMGHSQVGNGLSRVSNLAHASQTQTRPSAYREFVPQQSIFIPPRSDGGPAPELRTASFVRQSQTGTNLAASAYHPKKSGAPSGNRLIEDTGVGQEEIIVRSGMGGLTKSVSETGRQPIEASGVPRTSQPPVPARASSNIPKKSAKNTFFDPIQDDPVPQPQHPTAHSHLSSPSRKKVARTPEIMAHLREFHPNSVDKRSRKTAPVSPGHTTSSGYPGTLTPGDSQPLGSTRKTASTLALPKDQFCRFCNEYMHPECYQRHFNRQK